MEEILKPYRERIDTLDDAIVDLLVQRFEVVREIGLVKARHNIPVVLEDRIRSVVDRAGTSAFRKAPPPHGAEVETMVRELYMTLIALCCEFEEKLRSG